MGSNASYTGPVWAPSLRARWEGSPKRSRSSASISACISMAHFAAARGPSTTRKIPSPQVFRYKIE